MIVHHYLKGYTYAETGALLGLEVDTVRSRLQKGRKRLKKEMMTMAQEHPQPQTFTLTRGDLQALKNGPLPLSARIPNDPCSTAYISMPGAR